MLDMLEGFPSISNAFLNSPCLYEALIPNDVGSALINDMITIVAMLGKKTLSGTEAEVQRIASGRPTTAMDAILSQMVLRTKTPAETVQYLNKVPARQPLTVKSYDLHAYGSACRNSSTIHCSSRYFTCA